MVCNDTHITHAKIRREPQPPAKSATKLLGPPKQQQLLLSARVATLEIQRIEAQRELRDRWTQQYEDDTPGTVSIVEVALADDVYVFDIANERLIAWTGLSERQEQERDAYRLKKMPLGERKGDDRAYHRSHVKSHAEGGGIDMNIFPGLASLNLSKAWTDLEKYAREHLGTQHSVQLIYDDDTQVPARLEVEITHQDGSVVWREFDNS